MTNRDDSNYIDNLRNTAAALVMQAAEARRRGLYGLGEAFTEAANSAASWANSLADRLAAEIIERDVEARR